MQTHLSNNIQACLRPVISAMNFTNTNLPQISFFPFTCIFPLLNRNMCFGGCIVKLWWCLKVTRVTVFSVVYPHMGWFCKGTSAPERLEIMYLWYIFSLAKWERVTTQELVRSWEWCEQNHEERECLANTASG